MKNCAVPNRQSRPQSLQLTACAPVVSAQDTLHAPASTPRCGLRQHHASRAHAPGHDSKLRQPLRLLHAEVRVHCQSACLQMSLQLVHSWACPCRTDIA